MTHDEPTPLPHFPFLKRLWYNLLWVVCRILAVLFFRIRVAGREHIPPLGGVLIVSNHQSHLDPVLVALACDRRLTFIARASLFKFAPLRWMIQSLDAIPLEREGSGVAGLKETLRRLKRGEVVSVFPEGTRSPDGEIQAFKAGFLLLLRRAKTPVLPVALDGAFDAWPRSHKFPRPAPIRIQWGEPLAPATLAAMNDEQVLAEVDRQLRHCFAQARAALPK